MDNYSNNFWDNIKNINNQYDKSKKYDEITPLITVEHNKEKTLRGKVHLKYQLRPRISFSDTTQVYCKQWTSNNSQTF